MHRTGVGGLCPNCDEPVAVQDLLPTHPTAKITATLNPIRPGGHSPMNPAATKPRALHTMEPPTPEEIRDIHE